MEKVKVKVFGNCFAKMENWEGKEKGEGCKRQVCYRITYKGYESKECVYGDKKRFKGTVFSCQHMDQRLGHGVVHISQECVLWK